MSNKVIIDTDPGVDDLAAIYLAIASKKLDILAVTTVHGNIEQKQTTYNALALLEYVKANILVYSGAVKPLVRKPKFAKGIHGATGLGGVTLPEPTSSVQDKIAALKIIELAHEHPNEITIIALGPLTNLALALSIDPSIENKIKKIIFMGGAVRTHGNTSPVATFNIYCDPEAAKIVYETKIDLIQVGLDVCSKIRIPKDDLDKIEHSESKPGQTIVDAANYRRKAYVKAKQTSEDETGVFFNDVPAVAYALWPEYFTEKNAYVSIETSGDLTLGQTVAEFTEQWGHTQSNTTILMDVEHKSIASLFAEEISNFNVS